MTEETDPALYEQQETQNLESELTAENAETPVTVEEPIGSEDSETGDSSVILEAPVDVEEATDSQKSADEVQEPADQTETTEEVSHRKILKVRQKVMTFSLRSFQKRNLMQILNGQKRKRP